MGGIELSNANILNTVSNVQFDNTGGGNIRFNNDAAPLTIVGTGINQAGGDVVITNTGNIITNSALQVSGGALSLR